MAHPEMDGVPLSLSFDPQGFSSDVAGSKWYIVMHVVARI